MAFGRELQGDGDRVVEGLAVGIDKLLGIGADAGGEDLDGLGAEDIARHIDRIRSHVGHRACPEAAASSMVLAGDGLREGRVEEANGADLPTPDALHGAEGAGFEVQPVRHHEFGSRSPSGGDDALALCDADGHWLFKQEVDPGVESFDGVSRVRLVGRGEIDGVQLPRTE